MPAFRHPHAQTLIGLLLSGIGHRPAGMAISGKDIRSGAADARLTPGQTSHRRTGKPVVVNAPAIWHDKIAAPRRREQCELNDSFLRNVVVRVDKPAAKVEPAPALNRSGAKPAAALRWRPRAQTGGSPSPAAVPPLAAEAAPACEARRDARTRSDA